MAIPVRLGAEGEGHLMSLEQSEPRRTPSGSLYRSYEQRRERGWIKPISQSRYPVSAGAKLILQQTAADHRMTVAEMLSKSRVRRLAHARFDCMTRLRDMPRPASLGPLSSPHVAAILGLEDHTSVLNGWRRWPQLKAARAK